MFDRASSHLAFVTLLLTCAAGTLHLTWWAVCAGACGLILISLMTRQQAKSGSAFASHGISDPVLTLSSVLNGSITATAAYMFGQFNGWVWGV